MGWTERVWDAFATTIKLADKVEQLIVPSVSVLPALIVTAPPTFVRRIPSQLRSAPSPTKFGAVTVASHSAISPAPGTIPPIQEVVRFRSSKLFAFVICAWAVAEKSAIDTAQISGWQRTREAGRDEGARERGIFIVMEGAAPTSSAGARFF